MTYEPYLSTRAREARGRQDHRDDARLPDGHGHVRLHAEVPGRQPEGGAGAGRQLLRGGRDDQEGPEEELRDHGRGRQAERRAVRESAKYLRWQDKAANQKFFAGELQQFSKEAGDLLLEVGIIKAHAGHRPRSSTRSSSSSVDGAARSDARAHFRRRAHALGGHASRYVRRVQDCRDDAARARQRTRKVALGIAFFVLFVLAWSAATFGGFVSKTFLADPLTMLREGWALFAQFGFCEGHRHHDLARVRRLRARGRARRAARHRDGRLQAGRGVLRAVRLVRALPAGVGVHPAADPVGGHRRDAEAARDLHRLVLPDRADGGGHRGRDAARPRRGRLHARRQCARHRAPRAAAERRARHRRDAAPGPRLGVDLRDRRRADRRVERHRPHDHRQPGAAQHRPDHLRHHRDRRHRPRLRLRVQAREPALFPWSLA